MTKFVSVFVALLSLAYVSANFSSSLRTESTPEGAGAAPFATTLSQWIVETISSKIVSIARFFNLKLRLARFLVSLWTTENLVLFRNLLEEALRFGNFTLNFLPQSVDDPSYWWIPALSQFINISVGDAGPVTTGEVTDVPEEAESEISETVTNPPIFFNVPPSSTEYPTPESNEVLDVRSKRTAMEETVVDPEDAETNESQPEDILQDYEKRIMTLDKLINAGRTD